MHNTLTNRIFLFHSSFTSRAKISIGSSSYVKYGLSSIVSEETTCDGSDRYLRSMDTWKTLWIFSNSGGNAKWYATRPTFLITSYEPMNLGSTCPFFRISSPSSKAILSKTLFHRSHIEYLFSSCRHMNSVYR